jgi:hypothetical protein
VQRGRGREPDQTGQLDVRAVRIGLQHSEQPYVNIVKFSSHLAIDY